MPPMRGTHRFSILMATVNYLRALIYIAINCQVEERYSKGPIFQFTIRKIDSRTYANQCVMRAIFCSEEN